MSKATSKVFLYFFIGFLSSQLLLAQNLSVGHTTLTFNDPTRTGGFGSGAGPGRQIQTEIYYPAAAAGENVAMANGQFPLIVFGHGFAMNWDAYSNIWNQLVPLGYVVSFPRTESSIFPSPSHNDFGLDIALVAQKMSEQAQQGTSLFYGKLTDYTCAMGHSMGGGAAVLAASQNSVFDCYVGLAPAETSPSAISAAAALQIPALILSGSNDGVTPPAQHHLPIYDAIPHECKSFANLIGGGHCYFANANFNCDFGESTTSTGIILTRAEQQSLMYQQIFSWLSYFLNSSCVGYEAFMDYPVPGIDLTTTCPAFVQNTVVITQNGNLLSTTTQANTYQWYLNNQPVAGATNDSLIIDPNFSGAYNLLVTYNYGCAYSNNILGLAENLSAFQISPNPAQKTLYIKGPNQDNIPYYLFDLEGRVVFSDTLYNGQDAIDIENIKNGTYLLQLIAEPSSFQKVLIAH
jgi:dienelactone hydrolase